MKKITLLLTQILILVFTLTAQENQGAIHDNYNPVNGQYINPSNIVDAKPWLDINLVGMSAYLRNNYAYYPNTTLLNFASFENSPSFNTSIDNIKGYMDFDIKGPSISLGLGRHAVSVFSNVRGILNVKKIPGVLGRMASNEGITLADTGLYSVNNARVKSMIWGEVGVTYGKILVADGTNMLTGAITIKRLFGIQNSAVIVDDATVHVTDLENTTLLSTTGKYSYANPDFNAGRGWGTNIGVTYKKMKEDVTRYIPHSTYSRCACINYKYKIGVSVLDVGYINFKQNAAYGSFTENTEIEGITSVEDLTDESKGIQEGTDFKAWLPATVSLQVDYNLNDKVYFNGTVIQKIPMTNTYGVERENLLAVSARYETKYFGVGIPLILQNYVNPQIGLAFRFANLTIGSDNFLPIVFKQDVNSGDIYFNLKYTIFKNPACKEKGKRNKRHRKGRRSKSSVNCPAF